MAPKNIRRMWKDKLASGLSSVRNKSMVLSMQRNYKGVVLGLDVSLRGTGLAIVDFSSKSPYLVHSERITCPSNLTFFQCIDKIFRTITDVLKRYSVDYAAIEQTIYVQNYRISHILGAAKGAVIAALMQADVPIAEYEPLRIKQAVTGYGRAGKEQVKKTVLAILNSKIDISYDETDAAAAAICHAWTTYEK